LKEGAALPIGFKGSKLFRGRERTCWYHVGEKKRGLARSNSQTTKKGGNVRSANLGGGERKNPEDPGDQWRGNPERKAKNNRKNPRGTHREECL